MTHSSGGRYVTPQVTLYNACVHQHIEAKIIESHAGLEGHTYQYIDGRSYLIKYIILGRPTCSTSVPLRPPAGYANAGKCVFMILGKYQTQMSKALHLNWRKN